jgi:hypothetical protein
MKARSHRGRPVDPNSKLSRARKMFNRRTPRQEMLKIFCRKLKMTPVGAATYFQIVRR